MPKEKTPDDELQDMKRCGYWSVAAYVGPLCLLTWLCRRDSDLARYHANQGLVLFLTEAVVFTVLRLLETLVRPVPAAYIAVRCVGAFLTLLLFTFLVLGVMHAIRGEKQPLPLIGGIRILH